MQKFEKGGYDKIRMPCTRQGDFENVLRKILRKVAYYSGYSL